MAGETTPPIATSVNNIGLAYDFCLNSGDGEIVCEGKMPKEVSVRRGFNSICFYGPPGYGENPEKDSVECICILSLHRPLVLKARSVEDDSQTFDTKSCFLHIYTSSKKIGIGKFVGKKVEVKANNFLPSHTGHHRAPIIAEILSIKLL